MESKGPGPCAGWRESARFAHVCALFTWHGPIIVSYGNVFVCNRLKLEIFIDVVSSLFLNEYRLMHKKGPYTISWQERRRSDCALRSLICAFLPSSKNQWILQNVLTDRAGTDQPARMHSRFLDLQYKCPLVDIVDRSWLKVYVIWPYYMYRTYPY